MIRRIGKKGSVEGRLLLFPSRLRRLLGNLASLLLAEIGGASQSAFSAAQPSQRDGSGVLAFWRLVRRRRLCRCRLSGWNSLLVSLGFLLA